jgi:hypothetical protein
MEQLAACLDGHRDFHYEARLWWTWAEAIHENQVCHLRLVDEISNAEKNFSMAQSL